MEAKMCVAVSQSTRLCSISTVSQAQPARARKREAVMLPSDSQVPTDGSPALRARLTGLARMKKLTWREGDRRIVRDVRAEEHWKKWGETDSSFSIDALPMPVPCQGQRRQRGARQRHGQDHNGSQHPRRDVFSRREPYCQGGEEQCPGKPCQPHRDQSRDRSQPPPQKHPPDQAHACSLEK